MKLNKVQWYGVGIQLKWPVSRHRGESLADRSCFDRYKIDYILPAS